MGDFADYCGTALVRYLAQIEFDQTNFKSLGEAALNSFIAGTLIPAAEKFLDNHCNHQFGTPGLGTWRLDGNGKSFLPMPTTSYPLKGITAGSVGADAIDVSDLKIHDRFIQYDGGLFSSGKQNVVLFGSYGFVNSSGVFIIPGDVQMVCASLCANVLKDMVRSRLLPDAYMRLLSAPKATEISGNFIFHTPHIFPKALKEVIEPYRVRAEDVG